MRLQMIESRTKRAVFLETVCQALGLTGTRVHNCTLSAFLQDQGFNRGWNCVSWKALILKRADFVSLVDKSSAGTEFWTFHGAEIPLAGVEIEALLGLCDRESAPVARSWSLSIYRKLE
jgi:hypothetical protein